MIKDKEYSKFEKGIFKPYFGRYIEFKRSKGEKVLTSSRKPQFLLISFPQKLLDKIRHLS